MSWQTDMIDTPPFTNSVDFEMQFRRNMLIPEAYAIAEKFCGVEPPNTEVVAYKAYTDAHQRKYFRTMKLLWNKKYRKAETDKGE